MKRRSFLYNSTKLIGGLALSQAIPIQQAYAATQKIGANDKIRVALIGCNGMGWTDLSNMLKVPGVECVALCDVDQNVADRRNGDLEKLIGKTVPTHKDFRKIIDNKDIDAVIIGTPDHWHALPAIYACQVGKDVYVEKPLGRSIEECDAMLAAAQRNKRVVQVGQWQRSNQHFKDAIDFVHSGKLGKIRVVKTWAYQGWMKTIPFKPDTPVPAGVDYDMWLGPAPRRPFNENRFHFNFRWYWDYAGGLMTDWGVHILDIALLGMKAKGPKSVISLGGIYVGSENAMETPDTQQAIYEFDDYTMLWEHANGLWDGPYGRDHGIAFLGNNGTLVVNRGGWEVIPEKDKGVDKMEAMALQKNSDDGVELHTKNFIDCMKSREKPNCDIASAHNTALNASLGNISQRVGRRIYWDAENQKIIGDKKANALTKANYQNGWKLP
jgi:predicted dehydrogenase